MNKIFTIIVALILAGAVSASADDLSTSSQDVIPEIRQWIDKEVRYIISDEERAYLLTLSTNEERKDFIRAFWVAHDPTPGTIENEFKTEHYRRLAEAEERFAAEPEDSKRLNRKQIYILLGEPEEIVNFSSKFLVSDMEAWKYSRFPSLGIHEPFYLLWLKKRNENSYSVFPSGVSEPGDLLKPRYTLDPETTIRKVFQVDTLLGQISLSHLDKDHKPLMIYNKADLRRALSHRNNYHWKLMKLLMNGRNYNSEKRFTTILDSLDGRRSIIRQKFTSKPIQVKQNSFSLINEGEWQLFLVYMLDANELSLKDYYGRCYGLLNFDIKVRSLSGNLISTLNGFVSMSFLSSDLSKDHSGKIVHLESLDLPAGRYRVTTEIKNWLDASTHTVQSEVTMPARSGRDLQISKPVFLLQGVQKDGDQEVPGGLKYYPSPDLVLERGENAEALFQIAGTPQGMNGDVAVRYRVVHNQRLIWQRQEQISRARLKGKDFYTHKMPFPTGRFAPGEYDLEVSILSTNGRTAVTTQKFTVSHKMHNDEVTVLANSTQ